MAQKKLLMIDNYDSFTYNLVQALGELGAHIIVRRNDRTTLSEIEKLAPDFIVISPGPKTPRESGISVEVIKEFQGKIPILGVCLGCQCIGFAYGVDVVRAPKVMHGKTSLIYHDGKGVFKEMSNPFEAMRYHSLILPSDKIPPQLEVSARTEDGVIMGVRIEKLKLEGVQFHPESFLTYEGKKLLKNFLAFGNLQKLNKRW